MLFMSLIFFRAMPVFAKKPPQKMTRKYQDTLDGRVVVECWRGVNCYRIDKAKKFKPTRRYIVARPRQSGVDWAKQR